MGEQRKKSISILLKKTSKISIQILIYESMQWPNKANAKDGYFRVKVDGVWFSPRGLKYEFLSSHEIVQIFQDGLHTLTGQPITSLPERPNLPKGTLVRVPSGRIMGGERLMDMARTNSPVFPGADNQWHVFVGLCDKGSMQVLINDIEVVFSGDKLGYAFEDQAELETTHLLASGEPCSRKGMISNAQALGNSVHCVACNRICICPTGIKHNQVIKVMM